MALKGKIRKTITLSHSDGIHYEFKIVESGDIFLHYERDTEIGRLDEDVLIPYYLCKDFLLAAKEAVSAADIASTSARR